MKRKNPFRGIACEQLRIPKYSRHIEGVRDTRRSSAHLRINRILSRPFRDLNPTPCAFIK